jgi:hypothetical protein
MIKINSTTALLLHAQAGDVQPVNYTGDLNELCRMLYCDTVAFLLLAPGVGVFYPDETDSRFGFSVEHVNGSGIVFRGSGLIVGDNEGNPAPLEINPRDLTIKSVEYGNDQEED